LFGACASPVPDYQKGQFAEKVLTLSQEAEIKLLGRNPDGAAVREKIEDLAAVLRERVRNHPPGGDQVQAANGYFFTECGFAGDSGNNTPGDLCISQILETRRGSCLGLAVLYLILSERVGLPLYGVLLPGHIFLRYQHDAVAVNIEMLKAGLERSDAFYREKFLTGAEEKYYVKNLNPAQVVALVAFTFGNGYRKRDLYEEAKQKYQEALRLFPFLTEARENLENLDILQGK
jgi:tetratricopeptide (TPR) repeat protein